MNKDYEISYKQELRRKSIHLTSLLIPITYYFVTKEIAIYILAPMTILSIIIDLSSRKKSKFRKFFKKIFGKMLRPHEYYDVFTFNGATWVLISALACVIIFPKILMITGFVILIVSDISSALIGRRYGKHKIFVGKSLEGTCAFWISSFIVILILYFIMFAPWTFLVFGLMGAFAGGWAEAISTMLKMDDNIAIPITIGFVMWGGNYLADYYFNLPFITII